MNNRISSLFILMLAVSPALAENPRYSTEDGYTKIQYRSEFPSDTRSYQLEIHDVYATVEIRGTNRTGLDLTENIYVKTLDRSEAENIWERLHIMPGNTDFGHSLSMDKNDKRNRSDMKVRIEYILQIPEESSVAARLLGGDIKLQDIRGQLVLATYGGDINAFRSAGSIEFSTAGGDIRTEDLEGNIRLYTAGGDIRSRNILGSTVVETAGGDIDIETLRGTLKCTTMGGDIELSSITAESIEAETMGGDISILKSEGKTVLKSAGGDMDIRNLKGDVEAQTMGGRIVGKDIRGAAVLNTAGGNINVDGLCGAAKLETYSGDIKVEKVFSKDIENHDLTIITRNGDIILEIPDQPAFNLNANANGPGVEIKSDFRLVMKVKDKRKVVATYGEKDIRYTVTLESNDGDITISKRKQ